MSKLEEVLGAEAYAELIGMIRGRTADIKAWIKGFVASWSNRFGAALLVVPDIVNLLPEVIAQLEPELVETFGQGSVAMALRIIGAVTILLRMKTTKPLKERAT